uniref:glutathione transferase n=1 Tax=Acrobeloides nanus TaxID=290746 RepID=A0A914DFH0_9BILA
MTHYKLYYFDMGGRAEFMRMMFHYAGASFEDDKLYKEEFEPAAAKGLPIFEKYLKESGNGFYFKSGLTWADFFLSSFWEVLNHLIPDFFEKHPLLKENADKVNALPQIQKYLKERGDINKRPA